VANYADRQERARAALRGAGLEALLLTPGADMTYLTGFEHGHAGERLLAFVLRVGGDASWVAPLMNAPQVAEQAAGAEIRAWSDAEGYLPALQAALAGASGVAFDEEARSGFLLDLLSLHGGSSRVYRSSQVMRGVRIRKDSAEIAQMLAAGRTVDETIAEAVALCQPGRTEQEVEELLRAALGRRSPESSVAFTIVASGPNGALPHHETGPRVLEQGDVMVLDFGTRREGYHSDITVTAAVSEPNDPEVRRVYRTVWEAQQRALEAVRPGVPCAAIDRAAREQITSAGYGEFFLHRTGHGLGLQVHEPPYMVAGNEELLEEGMVFSVEPGIYLSGRFGVRLEVIASVTVDGVRLINAPSAPELPLASEK
jgi:D-alanyl-D-alanine dipeptidase